MARNRREASSGNYINVPVHMDAHGCSGSWCYTQQVCLISLSRFSSFCECCFLI